MRKDKPTTLAFYTILATIPLLFGAVHPLIQGIYSTVILLSSGIWLVLNFESVRKKQISPITFLPLVILAFIVITVIPLPFFIVKIISPTRAVNLAQALQFGQLENVVNTFSYYAPASQFYAVYGFALFLFYISSSNLLETDDKINKTLWIITLVGIIEAVYGIVQVLIPSVGVLWLPSNVSADGCARGTIIYRNQYAAFLNMCWPISLAHGISLYRPVIERFNFFRKKKKTLTLTDRMLFLFQKAAIPLWCSAFMILAIIFSRSRGGIIIMMILAALLIIFLPLSRRTKVTTGSIYSIFVLIYGGTIGFQNVMDRFLTFYESALFRFTLWFDSLSMLKDHFFAGIGMGAYGFMSPVYLSLVPDTAWYDHTHNEYVELLVELGLPMMVVLVTWLVWGLIHYVTKIRQMQSRQVALEINKIIAICSFLGILGFLLHGFVDFVWHIPVNVVYAITLLALLHATSLKKDTGNNDISISEKQFGTKRARKATRRGYNIPNVRFR